MARTKIRESQVVAVDFASEEEAQEFIDTAISNHESTKGHVPIPDQNTDDKKILRYDSSTDSYNLIPQADIQTIALPYYYDSVRDKYLGNELIRVVFSKYGSNKANTYMYLADRISSKTVPFKLRQDWTKVSYCLVSADWTTSDSNNGDDICRIKDKNDDYHELWRLDGLDGKEFYDDTLDIHVPGDGWLCARIQGTSVNNPVLVVGLRQIYNPQ